MVLIKITIRQYEEEAVRLLPGVIRQVVAVRLLVRIHQTRTTRALAVVIALIRPTEARAAVVRHHLIPAEAVLPEVAAAVDLLLLVLPEVAAVAVDEAAVVDKTKMFGDCYN